MKNYRVYNRVSDLSEIKHDLNILRKYLFYFLIIFGILSFLIYYNTSYIKKEKSIATLIKQKNTLIVQNLKLKKEITVLSSPDRIEKIAKEKLKMKPVSYSNVKFLKVNE